MAHLSTLISDIANSEIDFKSPLAEDLFKRFRDNIVLTLAAVASDSNNLLKGVIDANPPNIANSYITDAVPTNGTINRDDKFNGLYLRFTSGAIFTGNQYNRYKITDTDAALSRIYVAENLFTEGALLGDTYEIVGHAHDALDYPADRAGEFISMRALVNLAEGFRLTQNQIDALTDPNGLRPTSASITNPLATLLDILNTTEKAAIYEFSGNSLPANTLVPHLLPRTPTNVQVHLWSYESGSGGFTAEYHSHWATGNNTKVLGRRKANNASNETATYDTSTGTNGGIATANSATLTGGNDDIRITAVDGTNLTLNHSGGNGSGNYYMIFISS